jgi:hypothetical protein
MGFWSAIKGGNLDLLFVSEDDIATQAQVNTAQQANLQRQADAGIISQEKFVKDVQGSKDNTFEKAFSDPKNSPTGAFNDSVKENYDKLLAGVSSTVGGIVKFAGKTVFGILPWWLWLAVIAGAIFYFRVQLAPFLSIAKRLKK